LQIDSTSSEATEQLAEQLGNNLRGGELVELISDLGGGKTTFARGLVRGAGSTDRVASPTFTLSREYTAPKFTIVHFDFYRLGEAGIVGEELAEIMDDPSYVIIVEWGDVVRNVLPERRMTIGIEQIAEEARELRFSCPAELSYLMKGVAL
jgi:tRNA threonylcarbamoyladenosine biosynthesis protein TsaE